MKELDFDELDRAVNSLMSDAAKTSSPTPDVPEEKTLDLTSAATPPADAPAPSLLAAAPQPAASVASAVPPPPSAASTPARTTPKAPASRRGGRFMDMVHPSADMKKPEVKRPSRQGVAVSPRASFEAPPQSTAPTPPSQEIAPVPAPEVEAPSVAETTTSKPEVKPSVNPHPDAVSEWPDPLEMANFNDTAAGPQKEKEAPKKHEPIKPVAEVISPEDPVTSETKSAEPELALNEPALSEPAEKPPLTSPFLPDAKVEKRPLGGETPTGTAEPDHAPVALNTDVEKTTNDANDQLPALPEDVEPILPEEFHHELMAVESDVNEAAEADKPEPAPRELDEKLANKKQKEEKSSSSLPPEPEAPPVAPLTGPTSIPQQYREEPSSSHAESGAIYDTDDYHQPLAHPAKKKSGWLWVVWIMVILLLGAGGGAALYFFGFI